MRWLRGIWRNHQWRKQRARGILPECDCWDFKDTLVDHIEQGVTYLLRPDGYIDWHSDNVHKQMERDLYFVLEWTKEYKRVVSIPSQDVNWEKYKRVQTKAFRILDKYLWGLWD